MQIIEHGVPIDVLWFRITASPGRSGPKCWKRVLGKPLILINRSDYFQAGAHLNKGSYDEIRAHGLDASAPASASCAPYLATE